MNEKFIGYTGDECRAVNLNAAPLKKGSEIYASVGIGGLNQLSDVVIIQQALNDVLIYQGRPNPLLEVDGNCGAKTKSAIQNFQLKHFGWSGADGRVDPNGATIAKLNEVNGDVSTISYQISAGKTPPTDPLTGAARVARVRALAGQMNSCLDAAIKDATMALAVVNAPDQQNADFPSFSRAARMCLINCHFGIDLFPAHERLQRLLKVLEVFKVMKNVFSRPGNMWGAWIFDYNPTNDRGIYAFCAWGGYFRPGEKHTSPWGYVRSDTIYLSDKLDIVSNEQVVMTMIHELAHFVGFPEHITDHGYGWIDDPRMTKLVSWQRLYNAESYCNYSFDARFGRRPN